MTPNKLISERADTWQRRADKWHKTLELERSWVARGRALPALVAALCALVAALSGLGVTVPWAAAWPAVGAVITALISYRAHVAQLRLDTGRIKDAWVSADRIAEHYRGLVSQLCLTYPMDFDYGGLVNALFAESQQLESVARFGVPPMLQASIKGMTDRGIRKHESTIYGTASPGEIAKRRTESRARLASERQENPAVYRLPVNEGYKPKG